MISTTFWKHIYLMQVIISPLVLSSHTPLYSLPQVPFPLTASCPSSPLTTSSPFTPSIYPPLPLSPSCLFSLLSSPWTPSSIQHFQAENILSEIQKLQELIDQSESVILINLDSQRNIMRLGLQVEMGMLSAAISGLIQMAFGMNLQSSLEEV